MSYFNIKGRPRIRQGFTLIELLVVIVIIGILASLIMVGARAARITVRQGLIKTEIAGIDAALETYRRDHGEYPPDFSDEAAVMRHVRKRWPNYNPGTFATFCADIKTGSKFKDSDGKWYAWDFTNARGAHMAALAFWLGGMPEPSTGMLGGFSADVSAPMDVSGPQRETPIMELTLGGNYQYYIIEENAGTEANPHLVLPAIVSYELPIVYFKASTAGNYLKSDDKPKHFHIHGNVLLDELGCAAPYAKSGTTAIDAVWHNPKNFQLIHPGMDKMFSAPHGTDHGHDHYHAIDPSKDFRHDCTLEDNDNQANFGGNTIETSGN